MKKLLDRVRRLLDPKVRDNPRRHFVAGLVLALCVFAVLILGGILQVWLFGDPKSRPLWAGFVCALAGMAFVVGWFIAAVRLDERLNRSFADRKSYFTGFAVGGFPLAVFWLILDPGEGS